ncbi:hypothetical protein ACOSQ4_019192 [Xanthoceras sorbifolium]
MENMARDSTGFCGPDGDDMDMLFKARFMLTKIKNDINRYTVKCKNETCDWRFHASYLLNGLTFMIMSNELQEKYAIKCDSQIIYKAKKRVLKNLKADHMNSYAKIKQYANLLHDALWDDNMPICFISDKRRGLILDYEQTWPRAGSRYYFRHIIANFRATFENLNMTEKLWAASRVGDAAGFKEVMESINNDLVKARHTFDPRIKSDHNTNNMSECFNSWIKDDRDKPILTLMESLRRKVMVRFHEKRSIYSTKKMLFNLKEKTCNCGLWEFSGILCKHALVAFSLNNQFFLESVHWYYSKEAMKLTYNGNINLVPEEAL